MTMKTFKAELFDIDDELNLVAEISELQHKTNFMIQTAFEIQHHDETRETFELYKVDRSGDGDVAGWKYTCKATGQELLIIND